MRIALLSGGKDPHYVFGLISGLITNSTYVDLIGSDYMKRIDIGNNDKVRIYSFYESEKYGGPVWEKMFYIFKYYSRLLHYSIKTDMKLFHIQWEHKFTYFDRIILNIYFKILGKRIVFTAHNVNAGIRDKNNTIINRFSLKFMYRMVDHIIVHTNKMKLQLIRDFNIKKSKVTVIPYGINNMIPVSEITRMQAKTQLSITSESEKIILFFGNIAPYKGLIDLILAMVTLKEKHNNIKLVIAGQVKKNCRLYWREIQKIIENHDLDDYIIKRTEFIPDRDIELFYKSADVLIIPYRYIFQSGILFMSYRFGLPVIATDVGSLKEDIIEGKTGFVCRPLDPDDIVRKIEQYFSSNLYRNLEENRDKIIMYANDKYSWEKIGKKTYAVYQNLL